MTTRKSPNFSRETRERRLDNLRSKQQKLEMIEALITEHESVRRPDFSYLKKLRRQANEVRSQIKVLSTVEQLLQ
jgi:hypothetical protein